MEEKLYTMQDLTKAYMFGYIDRDCKLNPFSDEESTSYINNRLNEQLTAEDCWDGDETDKIQY